MNRHAVSLRYKINIITQFTTVKPRKANSDCVVRSNGNVLGRYCQSPLPKCRNACYRRHASLYRLKKCLWKIHPCAQSHVSVLVKLAIVLDTIDCYDVPRIRLIRGTSLGRSNGYDRVDLHVWEKLLAPRRVYISPLEPVPVDIGCVRPFSRLALRAARCIQGLLQPDKCKLNDPRERRIGRIGKLCVGRILLLGKLDQLLNTHN